MKRYNLSKKFAFCLLMLVVSFSSCGSIQSSPRVRNNSNRASRFLIQKWNSLCNSFPKTKKKGDPSNLEFVEYGVKNKATKDVKSDSICSKVRNFFRGWSFTLPSLPTINWSKPKFLRDSTSKESLHLEDQSSCSQLLQSGFYGFEPITLPQTPQSTQSNLPTIRRQSSESLLCITTPAPYESTNT